jgi:hypothetical protein
LIGNFNNEKPVKFDIIGKLAALAVFALQCIPASAQQPAATRPKFVAETPATPIDAPPGTWTLAVLPDTQYFAQRYPDVYFRQTDWIVKNKDAHRILFVAHEGDVTQDNVPREWEVARKAMKPLHDAKIPYSLLTGNHDIGEKIRSDSRFTRLNDHFSEADYSNSAAYGLFEPGKLENSWHQLDAPTGKYLLLSLEFWPRDEVLEWANEVAKKNADRKIILVTHANVNRNGQLDDSVTLWKAGKFEELLSKASRDSGRPPAKEAKEDLDKLISVNSAFRLLKATRSVNDGQGIWDKFTSRHPNVFMVLNGHIGGAGVHHLAMKGAGGQTVHQIAANYQKKGKLSPRYSGYLRLMQFHPDGRTVRVRTYSPWYDHWLSEPDQEFTIEL